MAAFQPRFVSETIDGQEFPVYENFHEIYRTISTLGRGSFGRVDLVEDKHSGQRVAAKFIKLFRDNAVPKVVESMKEVEILRSINSRNESLKPEDRIDIPEYYGCFLTRRFNDDFSNYDFVVLMEYIRETDMETILKNWMGGPQAIDRTDAKSMNQHYRNILTLTRWLYRNLANLHSLDVVHRDIKLVNIIKRVNSPGKSQFVLLDLGFSCRLPKSDLMRPSSIDGPTHVMEELADISIDCQLNTNGSFLYAAPELIYRTVKHVEEYKATDVWSAGITLWELANLKYFGPETHGDDQVRAFLHFLDTNVLETLYMPPVDRVIMEALNKNPVERPSAREITVYIRKFLDGDFSSGIRIFSVVNLAILNQ